jgi:hypothetical protein
MSVVEAVEKELEQAGAGTTLAETALALARGLDSDSSLTSKSMAAKSMIDVLRELHAAKPVEEGDDELRSLRARRAARLARSAAAQNSSRS